MEKERMSMRFLEYFPSVKHRLPLKKSPNLLVPELTNLQTRNEVFPFPFCVPCVLKL